MAFDAFLKLDGIRGELEDGSFEVQSFSFGVTNGGTQFGGGGGAGRAHEIEFTIFKKTDTATPKLFLSCATGQHIHKGELTLLPAVQEGPQFEYKLTFTDMLVNSFKTQGAEHGDDRPMEEVSFNFLKIEILSDGQKGGFDFRANRVL